MSSRGYFHNLPENSLAKSIKLGASISCCYLKALIIKLIFGSPVPQRSLSMQTAVSYLRSLEYVELYEFTDEDIPKLDIQGFADYARSLICKVNHDISKICQMKPFRVIVTGSTLLDCPDPIMADLYDADAAGSEAGSPRDIIGEILVSNRLLQEHCQANDGDIKKMMFELEPLEENEKVVLYFHGGGYMLFSPETHREMLAKISHKTNMRVIVPDYRLTPENPFPAQLHDAYTVWRKLLDSGFKAQDIVVGGDSAGGNLALSFLLFLKKLGQQMPSGVVLLSPWTDLINKHDSFKHNYGHDYITGITTISPLGLQRLFVGPGKPYNEVKDLLMSPLVSPSVGNFAGCPPILVQTGDKEMLYDENKIFVENLRKQQAQHEKRSGSKLVFWEVYRDMPHVFQCFPSKQTEESIESIANFIRSC
ncbi:hypothetical protein H4219_002260 [Mycoemilia scoparia]|uniref:Alpha/beta hydrolase fold-3 domain-containing protein n=1 Tax=Mycoemilia scoparia TaxID=417184 RepID=A0A9W8DUM9_9FUNG|nr:hypothetical protein H4219_002260 [Mycoemilia scoparia]